MLDIDVTAGTHDMTVVCLLRTDTVKKEMTDNPKEESSESTAGMDAQAKNPVNIRKALLGRHSVLELRRMGKMEPEVFEPGSTARGSASVMRYGSAEYTSVVGSCSRRSW